MRPRSKTREAHMLQLEKPGHCHEELRAGTKTQQKKKKEKNNASWNCLSDL